MVSKNKIIRKILSYGWIVAYKEKNEKLFHLIKNNRECWAADPFVFEYNNEVYIFAELWYYKKDKGIIGYCKLDNNKITKWTPIIEEDFHLSFPNIHRYKDDIYICPESNQSNQLYLYKAIDFPNKWQKDKILINNIKCCDTAFYNFKNGMFGFSYDLKENSDKLFIFKLKGDKINFIDYKPVLKDKDGVRNGGKIFCKNNRIIRVGQLGKNYYGEGLAFFEIVKCDKNAYKEKLIKKIKINDINYENSLGIKPFGIHTYNCSNNYEVIDLKIIFWNFYNLYIKIIKFIKKGCKKQVWK